ncbi:TPA: aspartate racemase [Candidatus Acetothermia bacterium]|nr:aspartate racemase [Candidatus Acetothermia bacterium]
MTRQKRVIGILGGMGPAATLALYERILALTPAERDQDHIRVIIDSNPKIPDRTAAILGGGESPLPLMIGAARTLERAGAHFIVIPCNTAHYWLSDLRKSISIPVIDMISETASLIATHRPPLRKIGLLATAGTLQTGLYQRALAGKGISVLVPLSEEETQIMDAIHLIKAGDHAVKDTVVVVAHHLIDQGAEGIILGCTELSLVVEETDLPCPFFDPLSILARRAVQLAREKNPQDRDV